jgi:hypothetical protein
MFEKYLLPSGQTFSAQEQGCRLGRVLLGGWERAAGSGALWQVPARRVASAGRGAGQDAPCPEIPSRLRSVHFGISAKPFSHPNR